MSGSPPDDRWSLLDSYGVELRRGTLAEVLDALWLEPGDPEVIPADDGYAITLQGEGTYRVVRS